MTEYIIFILIIVGAFFLGGWLSKFFQRRFKVPRINLIPRVTRRSRAIAILLAFVFGMAYFIETTFLNQYHIIFLMIAIIALAYSFRKRQDEEN